MATIETTTISPTGTKTLTLSDFQWIVSGEAVDPKARQDERADTSRASTRAIPRSTLPAVSMRRA